MCAPGQRPNAARRGRRTTTATLTLLLWCLGAAPAALATPQAPAAPAAPPRPAEPTTLLLGLIVDGREVDVVDVWFDGSQFWLPLEAFERLCRCRVEAGGSRVRVQTSLGEETLTTDEDIVVRDGTRLVAEHALELRLAVTLRYEPALMALVLDLPWLGVRARERGNRAGAAQPEIRAPATSLSAVTSQLHYGTQPGATQTWGTARLVGRAAGGLWRMRYRDGFGGARTLSEYVWSRSLGRHALVAAGHQRIDVHPLLGSLELTGGQLGWTNQPLDLFPSEAAGGSLLPRQMRTRMDVVGQGVPAGIAVLRVDDRVVASQTIPLDGVYRFEDVPLSPSRMNRVEVFVYERHNPRVPVLVRDHSRRADESMLPAGGFAVLGGLGVEGNALEPVLEDRRPVGFYRARFGVSEAVTLEATAALRREGAGLAAGAVARFGRSWIGSFAGSLQGGRFGYLAEFEHGDVGPWRVRVTSRLRRFGIGLRQRDLDHRLDLAHRWPALGLEIGVVGRYHRGADGEVRFLLPTLAWNPAYRVFLRARPDLDGSYRFDGSWSPAARWRIGVSHARGVGSLDVSWTATRRVRASAFVQRKDDGAGRAAVLLGWSSNAGAFGVVAGPSWTRGRPGALARVHVQVARGLLLAVQYESDSLFGVSTGRRAHRVSLDLATSLAFVGHRVVPARHAALQARTGGLSGRLIVRGEYQPSRGQLAGVLVRVDGRASARTDARGRFLLPSLPPGVYRVVLDPAGLPIELTPERDAYTVEVAEGAVTRVDFPLRVEFGIAGRVTVDGERFEGVRVDLLDTTGRVVATTRTDRFGLYRFDGVGIGTWRVRMSPANAPELSLRWPERTVRVRDDFAFGQDLTLSLEQRPDGARLRERIENEAAATGSAFAAKVRGLGEAILRLGAGTGRLAAMRPAGRGDTPAIVGRRLGESPAAGRRRGRHSVGRSLTAVTLPGRPERVASW